MPLSHLGPSNKLIQISTVITNDNHSKSKVGHSPFETVCCANVPVEVNFNVLTTCSGTGDAIEFSFEVRCNVTT